MRVIVVKNRDRYGRVVGRIFVGQNDVSAYMIKMGHAMVYRRYLTDESLLELESEAKKNQRGLWNLPPEKRVSPWQWRKSKREEGQ